MKKRFKVFVVDDDELGSKILIKNLEKEGFNCDYFNSGESFLAHLQKEVPNLVLLDILMPGLSGLEVLENIRQKYKPVELPVIMLTAKNEASDIVEALKLKANDYITKPANPDVASARVKTQIDLQSYYKDSLKKMELETLNSMIITYNHQINNPLAIALSALREDFSKMNEDGHARSRKALNRISEIVKSIHKITEGEGVTYTEYANGEKMLKLK